MKTYTQGFALVAVVWIVAALAVLGGGVYYASQSSEVKVDNTSVNATTSANAQVSLKDLFGKNVKCTFSTVQDGTESKGTAYINGDNLRVDAVTTQDDKVVVESHMIKVGSDAYVWSSSGAGAGQGAKIKVDATMEAQTKDKLAVDWDQKLDYDCDDWTPVQGQFSIPTNINFIDLSAMFDAKLNANGEVNKCASCDMIPDAGAKAQCKATLGCK